MRTMQLLMLLSMLGAGIGLGIWAPWKGAVSSDERRMPGKGVTVGLDLKGGSRILIWQGDSSGAPSDSSVWRHFASQTPELIRRAGQLQAWAAQKDPPLSALADACNGVPNEGYPSGPIDLWTHRLNDRVAMICREVHTDMNALSAREWAAAVSRQLDLGSIAAH